jgi:class 3 adenylate cyclase/tetratricopeptide (TPR) repeat protein
MADPGPPTETTDLTCEWCGTPLPAGARFCPNCGSPVEPSAAAGGPGSAEVLDVAERKVVTVLFADLARSTELANMLDAERFRELLSAFYALVSRELTSLRGRPEKFAGDAVMAVFGLPHAHEDDALRAVRAGLIIGDRTERLGERFGLHRPLGVRVGINSGPVAAGPVGSSGDGPSDRPLVSGAAVNLAARLQQAAEPGEILVGETTFQLTRYAVEFADVRSFPAKGFAGDVQAWPVRALSARSTRRTIPLVGRRHELRLIRDTFDRLRESSRAHLLTVLGEPGIGKSRLVDEFVAALPDDVRVLSGRAGEFQEDVTFAPIAEMLLREIGVDQGAPAEEIRSRLRDIVGGCCDPSEVERTAAQLGLALGLGEGIGESRRYRAAEIRHGLGRLLEGLTRSGPVVLVFEDLQLARPALLDLIDQLVPGIRRLPVLVVAVARDHLLEQRERWGSGRGDAITIRLEPLTHSEGAELALAAGGAPDEDTARRVAAQSGGNPFFIIETTGMMLQEHPEHLIGAPHGHILAPTVQAVVASRIDHLPEDARELIRKASVLAGGPFGTTDLQLVAQPRAELLRTLEDAELLVRDDDRPDRWRFRHEMLRDVAYESLPKRERQRLHLAVADALLEKEAERHRQAVAYHLEQAAWAALDLDPQDRSLADRAVDALNEAGDQARWRIESRTALDLYERALAMAAPEEEWGQREARILSRMGESRYWLAEFEEAATVLERALAMNGGDPWIVAHASRFLGDIELNVRARPDRAEDLFRDALEASRALEDPWAEARSLIMGAWVPYWRDDHETARKMFEEGLAIARNNPARDRWAEARALTSLASVATGISAETEAVALAEEAFRLGQEMHDPFTTAVARQYMGNSSRRMWKLPEALDLLDIAVRTFRDLDARWELASALSDRGMVKRLLGNLESAEEDLRETVRLCRQLGERNLITWSMERLIRVLVERGEVHEARRVLLEVGPQLDLSDPGARLSLEEAETVIALGMGDWEDALQHARTVLDLYASSTPNDVAGAVWGVGQVFGAEIVGGEEALERARKLLERNHWRQALEEPGLLLGALRKAGVEALTRG